MKGIKRLVALLLVLVVAVSAFSLTAFADDDIQAKKDLVNDVYDNVKNNSYDRDGGGSIKGSELFSSQDSDGIWQLDEDMFAKLSSSGQQDLVNDISKYSQDSLDDDSNEVSQKTVENWWKELQAVPGAGTKFMSLILQNTKPDYVTANKIYKPFSGVIGTIMGIIAVVGMGLLGIVLVADIFYIVIPPVQMLVADEGADKKRAKSHIFSNDAIYAVETAEQSGDTQTGGGKKQALGIYLKRRIPMLILLGICLMYLASGSIYVLVGKILDLVSGFLGF